MGAWGIQSLGLSDSPQLQVLWTGESPLESVTHPQAKWLTSRLINSTSNFKSPGLSIISFTENPTAKPFLASKPLEAEHEQSWVASKLPFLALHGLASHKDRTWWNTFPSIARLYLVGCPSCSCAPRWAFQSSLTDSSISRYSRKMGLPVLAHMPTSSHLHALQGTCHLTSWCSKQFKTSESHCLCYLCPRSMKQRPALFVSLFSMFRAGSRDLVSHNMGVASCCPLHNFSLSSVSLIFGIMPDLLFWEPDSHSYLCCLFTSSRLLRFFTLFYVLLHP